MYNHCLRVAMQNHYHLYQGDCLKVIPEKIEDESIDLMITSPPYFAHKEYEDWKDYDHYINFLIFSFKEMYRVIKPGCRLCINIDDKHTDLKTYGYNECWGTHAILISQLKEIYAFKDMIVWTKVRGAHATGGANYVLGSYPYPAEIPIITNYEYILIFRKKGKRNNPVNKTNSKLTFNEFKTYAMGLWNFPAEKQRIHPAPFPEELPKRLIKIFSFKNEIVLDPFLGSGTTMKVAQDLGRNCIGIELSPEYCEDVKKRCFGRQFLDRESPEYKFEIVE